MAGLTQDQVPRLQLKWAFGFPGASGAMPSQPSSAVWYLSGAAIARSTLLTQKADAPAGCSQPRRRFEPRSVLPQSLAPTSLRVFFGDVRANAYAVNATTGALVWKTKVEDHPAARITGAPTLYSGVLYVPVSSIEEVTGSRPSYQCCTFRGSVVALDTATGRQIWKAYTIPEPPHPTSATPSGPSSMVRPARRCGRRRRSMSSAGRSMSRPATTIRTRQRHQRCDPCVRSCDRSDALASAGHRQRQLTSSLVIPPTRPTVRKTTVPTTILASRRSW